MTADCTKKTTGSETSDVKRRCGYVAIVGRPNVGKSTLLNHMVGQKLSITSRKPQTTRHSLLGIKTEKDVQIVFVDTPGLHQDEGGKAVNRHMNRSARSVLDDVDVVLFVVDRLHWKEEDKWVAAMVAKTKVPTILVINKVDLVNDKNTLLPHIQKVSQVHDYHAIIPSVALQSSSLASLEAEIVSLLPEGDFFFPEDQVTDKSERFFAGEIVREKMIRQLGKELPYVTAVEIEQFDRTKGLLTIGAIIFVERAGQKAIVIGKQGQRLKKLGEESRIEMEAFFEQKVMLRLWVKVKHGWSNDERALKSLGLDG